MQLAAMSCRVLLVVVFTVAVVSKLRSAESFGAFVRSVQGFAVLSPRRGRAVARLVTGAEVAGVVLLLLPGPVAIVGFALVGCMLGAFTLAIGASLRRGVPVPCRCFGASTSSAGPRHLVRNGFLIAVAVTGAVGTSHGLPEVPGGLAVAAGTGLVLGVVVTVLDDISESLRDSFPAAVRKGQR
ncbi:MauE/DoxX family redox-associated membrane protein [Streptomyces atratus]|uniref:MauE/DoxX family redox-associated membrane protein n=1 Tax=Streptomyces atratus TaxID=1893 RepID=UPI001671890B|nr:MauE/DoxX family redox-associated membrane protein [Streptomyces atratus]WPW27305.1 MauE/DoxX family redox-associated membrane protein [Streptomyces atratus]